MSRHLYVTKYPYGSKAVSLENRTASGQLTLLKLTKGPKGKADYPTPGTSHHADVVDVVHAGIDTQDFVELSGSD